MLSLGTYPDVPLAGHKDKKTGAWIEGAREKRDHARKLIKQEIDPSVVRKTEKTAVRTANSNTFEAVAREWLALPVHRWAQSTADTKRIRLETHAFPFIGDKAMAELTKGDLEKILCKIHDKGFEEVARRVRQLIEQIFNHACRDGGPIDRNPAANLKGILPAPSPSHHAAVTEPKAVGALMRAIRGYSGEPVTKAALCLAPLVFVRPGELRAAEWSEIDLDGATWRIPAARMKMDRGHIVPLSHQAVAILREIQKETGKGKLVFPSIRSRSRPMSENTVNAALRRLGYTNAEMTGHGFRSMASTLLNEQGWHHDAIERQLAHAPSATR